MVGTAQQRHAQDDDRLVALEAAERSIHDVVHRQVAPLEELAHGALAPGRPAGRGNRAGADGHDPHAGAPLLGPQRFAESEQKRLRRGVDREVRLWLEGGRGGDVDDGAAVARRHRVDEEPGKPDGRLDVEVQHAQLLLERRQDERPGHAGPGVVDQEVRRQAAPLRRRMELAGPGGEPEVNGHGVAADRVQLRELAGEALKRLGVLRSSRDHEIDAALRKPAGEGLADARRRARHEGGLPGCDWWSAAGRHGRKLPARVALFARVLCVGAALLGVAAPAASGDGLPAPAAIAQDGFADAQNSYAWSMAWFKGALYVGTARSAMCVEDATIDYYLPGADYYRPEPVPGVSCPPTIHEADLRAEIWRYTPRTGRWDRVYRSPRVPNPRAPGRLVARDIGYRGMLVHTERGGRKALYVTALSPDEFIPELRRPQPPRILRTTDGRRFRALRAQPPVIHTYLGPYRPVGFRALASVGRSLYVTASAGLLGDGVVLRVRRPGGRSPSFEQVSPSRLAVFELAAFGGQLYAGTGDAESGYGVWLADPARPHRWRPVVVGGAGRGSVITSVVSMAPYRGWLYIGANGWLNSSFPRSELIRVARDGRWEVVVGDPRRGADGVLRSPLSGLPDGFGNLFNQHFWRMQTFRGALMLGTNDWSWSLWAVPGLPDELRQEFGFDLYGTCDGSRWWVATRDGFGRDDDFGVRTMAASRAGLFIGTTNNIRGTSIYRSPARPCAGATTRPASAARPAYVLPPRVKEEVRRERARRALLATPHRR